jgi:hypothetical protein
MGLFDRNPATGGLISPVSPQGNGGVVPSGGGGANADLSNLSSVAINTGLIFGASVVGAIKTKDVTGAASTALNISTGATTFLNSSSGNINIFTPDYTADDVSSGSISIKTGIVRGTVGGPVSGDITLETGGAIENGVGVNSGQVFIKTGNGTNPGSSTGQINIISGNSPQGQGHINITSGNATDGAGNSGNINITTGTAVTGVNRGIVAIDALYITLPQIGSSLVSSSPNNYDLGASANAWQQGYINLLKNAADNSNVFDVAAKQLFNNLGSVSLSFGEAISIQTPSNTGNPIGGLGLFTGADISGDEIDSGDIYGSTGNSVGGRSGNFAFQTGAVDGANPGKKVGDFSFQTGTAAGDAHGGSFTINVLPVSGSGSNGSFLVTAPTVSMTTTNGIILRCDNVAGFQLQENGLICIDVGARQLYDSTSGLSFDWNYTDAARFEKPFRLFVNGTDPASPSAGWIYYNSISNKLKFYNGTAWETVTSI